MNLSSGLTLNEAEAAITAIAAIHSLTLGMKLKEKVDLNEKYPVSVRANRKKREKHMMGGQIVCFGFVFLPHTNR